MNNIHDMMRWGGYEHAGKMPADVKAGLMQYIRSRVYFREETCHIFSFEGYAVKRAAQTYGVKYIARQLERMPMQGMGRRICALLCGEESYAFRFFLDRLPQDITPDNSSGMAGDWRLRRLREKYSCADLMAGAEAYHICAAFFAGLPLPIALEMLQIDEAGYAEALDEEKGFNEYLGMLDRDAIAYEAVWNGTAWEDSDDSDDDESGSESSSSAGEWELLGETAFVW